MCTGEKEREIFAQHCSMRARHEGCEQAAAVVQAAKVACMFIIMREDCEMSRQTNWNIIST